MHTERSTSQYTPQCLQPQVPKEETYVLTTKTPTPGNAQYIKPSEFTSNLNTVTADQPTDIECKTPEFTTKCLQAQVAQKGSYVLTAETAPASTQFMTPNDFTSTLNTITADQTIKLECNTSQYTTQCLEAQIPQQEAYVLTTETPALGTVQYVDPDVFTSTLNSVLNEQEVNIEYSTSEFNTECLHSQDSQEATDVLATETSTPASAQYMKPVIFTSTANKATTDQPKKIESDRASPKSSKSWTSPRVSNNSSQSTVKKTAFAEPLPPVIRHKKKKPPVALNTGLTFEFLRSPRGKKALKLNGIIYRMTSAGLDKVRWRCSTHERYGCKAIVHTLEKHIIYFKDEHITSGKKRLPQPN